MVVVMVFVYVMMIVVTFEWGNEMLVDHFDKVTRLKFCLGVAMWKGKQPQFVVT